jgi:hypothetical protein
LLDGTPLVDLSGGTLVQSLTRIRSPSSHISDNFAPASGFQTPLQEAVEMRIIKEASPACGALLWSASGSDALELALWAIARAAGVAADGIRRIVVREGSYHGASYLARLLSLRRGRQRDVVARSPIAVESFPVTRGDDREVERSHEFIRFLEQQRLGQGDVVLLETIPTTGAHFWPGETFYRDVIAACRSRGVRVVLDEVACGAYRHGWFSGYSLGLEADAILLSKGLACGVVPISAVLFHRDLAQALGECQTEFPGFTISLNDVSASVVDGALDAYADLQSGGFFDWRRALVARSAGALEVKPCGWRVETTATTLRLGCDPATAATLNATLRKANLYVYNTIAMIGSAARAFFVVCPSFDLERPLQEAFFDQFLTAVNRLRA